VYTQRERAALGWAEALTDIQEGHAPDVLYEAVREHFTEVDTVNLTLVITTINAWNRISIGLGEHAGRNIRGIRREDGEHDSCGA
jgi:alkylhydroperoxidase family enzyme